MKNHIIKALLLFFTVLPAMAYRDLETGTFISRDPAGFVDGPNLYAYVNQNPWTKFDPTGLRECTITDAQASGLQNSASTINSIVNAAMKSVMADVRSGKIAPEQAKRELFKKLTSGHMGGNNGAAVKQATSQGADFVLEGKLAGSKYEGGLQVGGGANFGVEANFGIRGLTERSADGRNVWTEKGMIAPGLNVNGEAIGADKLDHIFFDGYDVSGKPEATARKISENHEETFYGKWAAGVYSDADINANMVGAEMYNGFDDAVKNEQWDHSWDSNKTDWSKMNENKVPNKYTPATKAIVEKNENKNEEE